MSILKGAKFFLTKTRIYIDSKFEESKKYTDKAKEDLSAIVSQDYAKKADVYSKRETDSKLIEKVDKNDFQEEMRGKANTNLAIGNFSNASSKTNYFNKDTIEPGKYVDNDGNILESERLALSDYIPVKPNTNYTVPITFSTQGYFYDKDKEPLEAVEHTNQSSGKSKTFTTPSNAAYVRLNLYKITTGDNKGNANYFMLVEGDSIPEKYIGYGVNVEWLNSYSKNLLGKKIVTFGDSVTWYDQQFFVANTTDAGSRVVGYQSYLRTAFGCEVNNQGLSSENTKNILARSKAFDYTGYSLVTFLTSINDFGQSRQLGTVAPIGSSFDESTFCGAYQAMIEDVINRFPTLKIGIIIPYKVWNNNLGGMMPRTFAEKTIEIAQLYSLPYLNLYDESQINELNKDELFVDDTNKVPYQYHLNNTGYQIISQYITSFVNKIIG